MLIDFIKIQPFTDMALSSLCDLLMSSFLLQLDSKAASELKEEDEEDFAMNSECYLEVRLFYLGTVKGSVKPFTLISSCI